MIRNIADRLSRYAVAGGCFCLTLLADSPALATQGHAGVEGVWVHQFAHIFFLLSMVLLIYWLRQAGLVKAPGWRYIQYAAFFFILWNADAFLVHFLDEQILAVDVSNTGPWHIRITAAGDRNWVAVVYYVAKLDHLLCVPAMVFLMLGLRFMLIEARKDQPQKGIR
ncbi:hypothetical protein [Desulfosarcina sp.]|uniref:hypothetical protein n=1 Tax=Desulfosarcina sp. TaxID=2027861 RepID=UPI0039710205